MDYVHSHTSGQWSDPGRDQGLDSESRRLNLLPCPGQEPWLLLSLVRAHLPFPGVKLVGKAKLEMAAVSKGNPQHPADGLLAILAWTCAQSLGPRDPQVPVPTQETTQALAAAPVVSYFSGFSGGASAGCCSCFQLRGQLGGLQEGWVAGSGSPRGPPPARHVWGPNARAHNLKGVELLSEMVQIF